MKLHLPSLGPVAGRTLIVNPVLAIRPRTCSVTLYVSKTAELFFLVTLSQKLCFQHLQLFVVEFPVLQLSGLLVYVRGTLAGKTSSQK